MKPFQTAALIAVLFIALCGGGYWLLIRRNLVTALPSGPGDDSGRSGVQGVVREVLEPVREVDLQITHDRPIRDYLTANWKCVGKPYIDRFARGGDDGSDGSADFVEISPDGACRFSLHEFQHVGRVVYDRSYAGFFTEFRHKEETYIFIFSPDDETWEKETAKQLAVAFVGHDTKQARETDYQGKFTRMPNRVGTGIGPAPPTPPGMRIRTGRFPSVMVPVDAPLQGRSGTEF